MAETTENSNERATIKQLPRNVWAVGLTSFFMDISSEMVLNILPLFLSNVLGVKTNIIGLIEGIAGLTVVQLHLAQSRQRFVQLDGELIGTRYNLLGRSLHQIDAMLFQPHAQARVDRVAIDLLVHFL